MSAPTSHRLRIAAAALLILLVWELVGRLGLVAGGALPAPTAIAAAWWENRSDYPPHVLATTGVAAAGFTIGNLVAVALAVGGQLVPAIERLLRPTLVVLFCLPVVVAAPILDIAFDGSWPAIALAVLLVFFPTYVATQVGLRSAPGEAVAVVRSAGGGAARALVLVRLRAALPEILSGLQISAPAAVLGAVLGEFLGGRWGLGIYLVGTMSRGDAAALWAIGLTATLLSAILYGLVGIARRFVRDGSEKLLTTDVHEGHRRGGRSRTLAWTLGGVVILVVAWYGFIASTGLPTTLMNSPAEVLDSLFFSSRSELVRERLAAALVESAGPASLGAVIGIVFAFVLAVAFSTFPALHASVLPFAFISQTVPLVALAPLIALVSGRGPATIVAVTVSVTFFPSLVTIMQGLAAAPAGQLLVMRSVDASRLRTLGAVVVPNALPYLLASIRLAVPRALTGVLIAEQFITGTGLGRLLSESRGTLDYRMMWVIAAVVAALSLALYGLAQAVEDGVMRRRR